MKVERIITTKHDTVGLVTATGLEKTVRVPGYFNKDLIKEAVDKYFDLFGSRDISLFIANDGEGAAMLMFRPDENKDVFVCIAGKSEKVVYE